MGMTKEELQTLINESAAGFVNEAVKTEMGKFDEQIAAQNKLIQAFNKNPDEIKDEWKENTVDLIKAIGNKNKAAELEWATAHAREIKDFSVNKQVSSASFLIHPEYTKQIYDLIETYGVARIWR